MTDAGPFRVMVPIKTSWFKFIQTGKTFSTDQT